LSYHPEEVRSIVGKWSKNPNISKKDAFVAFQSYQPLTLVKAPGGMFYWFSGPDELFLILANDLKEDNLRAKALLFPDSHLDEIVTALQEIN